MAVTTVSVPSYFFWQYHPWIKPEVHENKGNDPLLKKLLIVKQILLVSTKEV